MKFATKSTLWIPAGDTPKGRPVGVVYKICVFFARKSIGKVLMANGKVLLGRPNQLMAAMRKSTFVKPFYNPFINGIPCYEFPYTKSTWAKLMEM